MSNRIHGGKDKLPYDFSVNINPLIDQRWIKNKLALLAKFAMSYPEERGESLVNKIAQKYKVPCDNIVLGNGSIELFYYLPIVLKPKRVITLEPTFCEYSYISLLNSIPIKRIMPEKNFFWSFSALKKVLRKDDVVFLCNPNNPTGTLFKKEDILGLLETDAFIVVDEAFMDFSVNDESVIRETVLKENLIVVKSLTKIYSLAGLRIGFMAAAKDIVANMKKLLPLWNVNGVAIEMVKLMMEDDGILERTKKYLKRERNYLYKKITNCCEEIKVYPGVANFLLCQSKKGEKFISFAREKGFALRDSGGFYGLGKDYFRIAVKNRLENKKLINLFETFFQGQI